MAIQLKRSLTSAIDTTYVLAEGQVAIDMRTGTNSSSTPFGMKIGDGKTTWANLPWSDAYVNHAHSNYLSTSGTAASATKLATSRTIRTNLASTATASFDGTASITPGVTGTLPIANGGTGSTTAAGALSAIGAAAASHTHSDYLPLTGGTLTGNLRLKNSTNYGMKLNFGDSEYVYLAEESDDILTIKAKQIKFVTSDTSSSALTLNGAAVGSGSGSYLPLSGGTMTGNIITSTSTGLYFGSTSGAHVTGNDSTLYLYGGTGQVAVASSYFYPTTTNTLALGASNLKWTHLYMTGNINLGTTSNIYFGGSGTSGSLIQATSTTCLIRGGNSQGVTVSSSAVYPYSSSGMTLGTQSRIWSTLYASKMCLDSGAYIEIASTDVINIMSTMGVEISSPFVGLSYCGVDSSSFDPYENNKLALGNSTSKWTKVYATTGTIQTSDRSAKHDIHYLSDTSVATVSEDGQNVAAISLADIMEFLSVLEPATFLYDEDEPSVEGRQLGLIADDIENTTLFPYIGCRMRWDAVEDILDDAGNVKRAGHPEGSSLGLKPIPLAVAALTACKYLIQRNEILESQNDAFESRLKLLESKIA